MERGLQEPQTAALLSESILSADESGVDSISINPWENKNENASSSSAYGPELNKSVLNQASLIHDSRIQESNSETQDQKSLLYSQSTYQTSCVHEVNVNNGVHSSSQASIGNESMVVGEPDPWTGHSSVSIRAMSPGISPAMSTGISPGITLEVTLGTSQETAQETMDIPQHESMSREEIKASFTLNLKFKKSRLIWHL